MKFKGLVKFFTVVLILISLYQLSFTFVVNRADKKIEAEATQWVASNYPAPKEKFPDNIQQQAVYEDYLDSLTRERVQAIEDSTAGDIVYNTLIKKYTLPEAKGQELSLGLDLKGGMNVVLEVSLKDLIHAMANNTTDPAFNQALEMADKQKANSAADFITLFAQAWQSVKPEGARLAPLFSNAFEQRIDFNSSDAKVIEVIRTEAGDAVRRTYNVLGERIDKFGVASPEINLDVNQGIITVALPGVHNPKRVRQYLQATAQLEFWETFQPTQEFMTNVLQPMDQAVAASLSDKSKEKATVTDSSAAAAEQAPDSSATAQQADSSRLGALAELVEKKGGQDTAGGGLQALADNPLMSIMGQAQTYAAVGSMSIGDTAIFNRYLQLPAVQRVMPRNLKFLYGTNNGPNADRNRVDVYAIKMVQGSDQPRLGGEHVVDARQDMDMNGKPEISMTMDNVGAKIWADMTRENVHKPIAIVLDNVVYSAPAPSEEISGGRSSITGSFTIQEAQDLANILQTGKLPAPAHIVQEQIIGPTLGHESIVAGAKSFIISFIIIIVLMLLYYNTAGIVANIALIFNMFFTIGVLAALGATLTLPGIAGLILAIGMAVDTNVIIFERIKEEVVKGKGYATAIADGYKHSYAPVLDGQITTLLTAIILFYFGLGPVKGFATTQILGILLSLFCGILISRIIEDYWTNKNRHFKYFTTLSKKIFQRSHFDFVKARKVAYVFSAIIIILGVASFFHGFNQGVEFSGGRSYTVRFDKPVEVQDLRNTLNEVFGEYPIVKTVNTSNQVNITTSYRIEEQGKAMDSVVEHTLFTGLQQYLPEGTTYTQFDTKYKLSSQTVLPTISENLKKGAVEAAIIGLLAIFLYILIRFRRWQFSAGGLFSLLHDVLVVIIVFSFLKDLVPFPMEIDQQFIAAVLTVIGYSINDTVIVFDRIREYFQDLKGVDRNTVINRAINDTLSRTIMTSFTVFIVLLVLFIVGGESTRGFAFAMLIGVITGTYSSIFVAAPVLVDFDRKNKLVTTEEAKRQEKKVRLESISSKNS